MIWSGVVLAVAPYAVGCAVVAPAGGLRAMRWVRGRAGTDALGELVAVTATTSLLVAGLSLICERAGYELLGFSLPVLGLTLAHFHFAGFAAVLLAGLVADAAPGPAARWGAVAVPVGTAVVTTGDVTGRVTELVGALVLAAGLLASSWVVVRRVVGTVDDRTTRALLLTAAWATPVTMALAVGFALGRATGLPHLSIAHTAATHGVVNALGVALCGLLAWSRTAPRPL